MNAIALLVLIAFRTTLNAAQPAAASPKSFFLVASHNMPDPVFQQTVILMLPSDEPPLVAGVIINKPTKVTLSNLFKQQISPSERNQKVYFGGPVEISEPLLVVRTSQPPASAIPLAGNVYAEADPRLISNWLRNNTSNRNGRLFMGRAQWAQEQLRGELLEGAWTVVPLRSDLIFDDNPARVWSLLSQHEHVREIGAHCDETLGALSLTMCRGSFAW